MLSLYLPGLHTGWWLMWTKHSKGDECGGKRYTPVLCWVSHNIKDCLLKPFHGHSSLNCAIYFHLHNLHNNTHTCVWYVHVTVKECLWTLVVQYRRILYLQCVSDSTKLTWNIAAFPVWNAGLSRATTPLPWNVCEHAWFFLNEFSCDSYRYVFFLAMIKHNQMCSGLGWPGLPDYWYTSRYDHNIKCYFQRLVMYWCVRYSGPVVNVDTVHSTDQYTLGLDSMGLCTAVLGGRLDLQIMPLIIQEEKCIPTSFEQPKLQSDEDIKEIKGKVTIIHSRSWPSLIRADIQCTLYCWLWW